MALGANALATTIAADAGTVAEFDADNLRKFLLQEAWGRFRGCFLRALDRDQRWAALLYARIAGWVNAQPEVAVLVLQQVGAPIADAKRAVQLVEESQALSYEARVDLAREFLETHNRLHPDRRVSLEAE